MYLWLVLICLPALAVLGLGIGIKEFRRRGMDRWIIPYLVQGQGRRLPGRGEPIHVVICIADHFEPKAGGVAPGAGAGGSSGGCGTTPHGSAAFATATGGRPRHTFFFPIEEYDPEHLDALAELCRAGFGEVEIHLHHDNDTAENLRKTLLEAKELLAAPPRPAARATAGPAELAYGFIHGNWALDNSRPDGRWCGVNNELDVLRETGCYADFTFPSAPSPTQTRKINSIYYAVDDPAAAQARTTGASTSAPGRPRRTA